MSLDTNKYSKEEWIELYLSGDLTGPERQEFETAIREDPSLREDVELTRHILSGFRHKGEATVLEELKMISSEEELKRLLRQAEAGRVARVIPAAAARPAPHSLWYGIGVAAAILVLVFIGYQPRYTSSELYMAYHRIPAYEYFPSRGGVERDSLQQFISQGEVYYERGEYAEALYEFEKVIPALSEADVPEELWYYSAICLMEIGQTNIAIKRLERLAACEACEFQEDALWQMALFYLSSGDKEKARHILSGISAGEDSRYAVQAKEIVHKLTQRRWF